MYQKHKHVYSLPVSMTNDIEPNGSINDYQYSLHF